MRWNRWAAGAKGFVATVVVLGCVAVSAVGASQDVDTVSRFLAGVPVEGAAAEQLPTVNASTHVRTFDRQWRRFDERIGSRLDAWAAEAVPGRDAVDTVFYPFAGADLVTVSRLYPRARRYVLIARQPAGPTPDVSDRDVARSLLDGLVTMVSDFGSNGFFVTVDLDESFGRRATVFQGITPIFLAMAAREGYRVRSVQAIRLTEDGSDVEVVDAPESDTRTWASVRIRMERAADGADVTLDYLALNLADENLSENAVDRAFVERMSGYPVLIKAGSHLLQNPVFSVLRDTLLERAPVIVQDETGLEYERLVGPFDVALYGNFTTPHRHFSERLQRGLAAAYAELEERTRLNFRFGYLKASGTCIQVATRRAR